MSLGYLDGATQFAKSFGGGDTSFQWAAKKEEENRHFAYICMMQAQQNAEKTQPKQGMRER